MNALTATPGLRAGSENHNAAMYRTARLFARSLILSLVVSALLVLLAPALQAQDRPPERVLRTYVPPDQIVSYDATTPLNQFFETLNPIFQRVYGKQIVEPENRKEAIGLPVAGMHFFDAFQYVLQQKRLVHRETERFFMVEPPQEVPLVVENVQRTSAGGAAAQGPVLATLGSREVQISAVLFEVNVSRARELGVNWGALFGSGSGGNTGGTGGTGGSGGIGGSGSSGSSGGQFTVPSRRLLDPISGIIRSPEELPVRTVLETFRYMETMGLGETVANPSVTVQSGQKGRIQIGSDVPVQTRDFAGNTITQFFSTGIIVDVLPTLLTEQVPDTEDMLDFIHLDVDVEKSGSRPSLSGLIIDRNKANTRVLLLNGEQTVIGGLFSTEETLTRRGVPGLKDLPGWFFGLRYLFGYTQRLATQKELVIVLQAELVDALGTRAQRSPRQNLLDEFRRQSEQSLQRVDDGLRIEPIKNLPDTRP
jgi:hypothetical protein